MASETVRPRRAQGDRVPYQRLSAIHKIRVPWLWRPFFQRCAINVITGEPGVSKSTLVCEIAAILSTGRPWPGAPDDERRDPMKVWLCNGEDAANDTIAWRLGNQGANPDNVFVTDVPKVITPAVVREMEDVIVKEGIAAIFIDPMQAWMGGGVDMNRANEMREWASMLREMAMRTGCAVTFVRHRRKGAAGERSVNSGLGSIDTSALARSEVSVVNYEKTGLRVMSRAKGTVGKTGNALAYTIEDPQEPGNDHGVLVWKLDVDPKILTCAVPTGSRMPRALLKAQLWLHDFLKDGPKSSQDCHDAGREQGFSEATLRRAKKGIVTSIPIGANSWMWQLTPTTTSEAPSRDLVGAK